MNENENENLQPIQKLTPFTKMIMTIGTLPSSFYASMSYYESMVWLYEYLKNHVIPTVNNNGEAVEELQTAFTTLETFISEYFENLDVQEEINNKLDEMAEDGSLTNLIKNYVDPIYEEYETDINREIDNFESSITNQMTTLNNKVDSTTSGSPLVASSTEGMTDTTRVYVNTTDGKWYYYDGDSWEIGGTYQASEDSGSVDFLKNYSVLYNSNNLLDYTKLTTGKLITSSSGELTTSINSDTTDYMYVEKDVEYSILGTIKRLLQYDIGKEPITATYSGDSQTDATYTPSESGYLRVSIANTTKNIMIIPTSKLTNVYTSPIDEIKDNIKLNDYQYTDLDNKFLLTKMLDTYTKNFTEISLTYTDGSFFSPSTASLSETTLYKYTTYEITNENINRIYRIVGTARQNARCFVYTKNGVLLEYFPRIYANETDTDYLFIPKTTGILYINSKKSDPDTKLYYLDSLNPVGSRNNILYKKKLVTCGDSFTAYTNATFDSGIYSGECKTYPYLIALRNDMTLLNLASSGSLMTNTGSGQVEFSVDRYQQIPADTDYLLIKYGINDFIHSAPLGTITDTSNTTFYGAWNTVMSWIIANRPLAKIGIIVTNGMNIISNQPENNNYADAIIKIAKKYGIPYLNEWNDPQVPLLLRTGRSDVAESIRDLRNETFRVSADNLHENYQCHEYESTIVEDFLRRL